jgi:hypothetical protein
VPNEKNRGIKIPRIVNPLPLFFLPGALLNPDTGAP